MDSSTQAADDNNDTFIIVGGDIPPGPFGHQTYLWILLGIRGLLTGPVGVVGVISNIINILVFKRQGITENSPTVTLATLALSDLWYTLFNTFGAIYSYIEFDIDSWTTWKTHSYNLTHVFMIGRPQSFFGNVTSCVTAYAAIERFVSVTFPFKIKVYFTVRRTIIIMVLIYILNFLFAFPLLFEWLPETYIDPNYNITLLDFLPWGMPDPLLRQTQLINSAITFLSMGIVLFCNVVIIYKVKASQQFRSVTTRGDDINQTDSAKNNSEPEADQKKPVTKEMRLAKMIIVISSVFIVCTTPYILVTVIFRYVYTFNVDYHVYTNYTVSYTMYFMRTVNSSVNFIIYLQMSTQYREEFKALFRMKSK